jgi:threonine synthase
MIAARTAFNDHGVISRYRQFLPVSDATPVVSLSEGATPLIHSPRLSAMVGRGCDVFLKYEGLNPTGSFKDRGMTVAISKAMEAGAALVVCASTGNTSASAAAYAARAGIESAVLLPAGKIAGGKMMQVLAYGARVIAIEGNFDDALRMVRELGEDPRVTIVNSVNPHRIEGQKTAAFEIVDELGDSPDIHILPVGNAGNITAYWKGYREFHANGRAKKLPRMIGIQAAGAAPIYHNEIVTHPETCASAIRIGNPASWEAASAAMRDSAGAVDIVSDEEILEAQSWLASHEGVFVEPASAASVAGLIKCANSASQPAFSLADVESGSRIVCTVTGHGLKDTDIFKSRLGSTECAKPDVAELRRLLDLG